MASSVEAVRHMYAMGPDDRDARARVMEINFKRVILEEFIKAPAFASLDECLNTQRVRPSKLTG